MNYIRLTTLPLLILFLFAFQHSPDGERIPENYHLLYQQDFDTQAAREDFEFSDPTAWRVEEGETGQMELFGESDYRSRVRSPFNIALLKDHLFGDFILEVNLAQSGKEYGHRDLCLFFGAQNATNFYYVHIASVADDKANNVFIVNDEPRIKISDKTTSGTDWGATNSWHKARIERVVETGTIKVYFDDMTTPIMEATDTHFDVGRIGFGSFDDTGKFDNIRIWGPTLQEAKAGFFR